MKYRIIFSAALLTLFFASPSVMAAKVKSEGEVEVVHLSRLCAGCLLHCVKYMKYVEYSLEECAKTEDCKKLCKTEE